MSRRTQDVLVYGGLLAFIGLCLWAQHRVWRKAEDRLVNIERRLQAAETNSANWSEFAKELRRITATTNVVVQQDATGSHPVRWSVITNHARIAAPGAAEVP